MKEYLDSAGINYFDSKCAYGRILAFYNTMFRLLNSFDKKQIDQQQKAVCAFLQYVQ